MKRNDDLIPSRANKGRGTASSLVLNHGLIEGSVTDQKVIRNAIRSSHIDSASSVSPPNGNFEHYTWKAEGIPMDHWHVQSGSTWGDSGDLHETTDANGGRAIDMRATANICRIASSVFAVISNSFYNLDIKYRPTASGGTTNLNVILDFYKDAAGLVPSSTTPSQTHLVGLGVSGLWQAQKFRNQPIPADTNFARVRLEKTDTTPKRVEVDSIFLNRFDIGQPSWIQPALSGTWIDLGGGWGTMGYFLDSFGVVHLKGAAKNGAIPSTLFTLLSGYRPPTSQQFAVSSNGALGICSVSSTGVVEATSGNAAAFFIDGISFRID